MPARHTDLTPRLIADDPTAWAVHRDALLEACDPRGALAAEQTGAPIAHAALPAHQRQLIDAHGLALHLWRPARFDGGPRAPLLELAVNTGQAPDEPGRTGSLYTDLQRLAAAGGLRELTYFEAWGVGSLAWVPAVLAHTTPTTIKLAGSVDGTVIPALVETDAFTRAGSLALEGFWPDDDALEVLINALEQRETPLASYRSTGRELDGPWRARLEATVGSVRASG